MLNSSLETLAKKYQFKYYIEENTDNFIKIICTDINTPKKFQLWSSFIALDGYLQMSAVTGQSNDEMLYNFLDIMIREYYEGAII